MSDTTKIEWADSTFNPWIGCTKVSPACDNCYAENLMDKRMGRVEWGAGKPRSRTSAANWKKPVQWNAKRFMECGDCGWRGEAAAEIISCGHCGAFPLQDARRRVFCASLADVFDNEVDAGWRSDLFQLIAATPNLDWLLLTKRIGNVRSMVPLDWLATALHGSHGAVLHDCGWPPNAWLGITVVNQEEADRDIPKLLQVPAAVRFLSIEPMLGPVDLTDLVRGDGCSEHHFDCLNCDVDPDDDEWAGATVDWVIVGGESGANARPMHPNWVRSLRDQCKAAGTAFLFKQWGEFAPNWYNDDAGDKIPGSEWIDRQGKKIAGNTLDGRKHLEWPA